MEREDREGREERRKEKGEMRRRDGKGMVKEGFKKEEKLR